MSISFRNMVNTHLAEDKNYTVITSHSWSEWYLACALDSWPRTWENIEGLKCLSMTCERHYALIYFFSPTALLELCDLIGWWKAGGYYLQKAPSFTCVCPAVESNDLELKHSSDTSFPSVVVKSRPYQYIFFNILFFRPVFYKFFEVFYFLFLWY